MELEAEKATKEELFQRYRLLYPKDPLPPEGYFESDGSFIPDADGGVERLRQRLGSISRFVQEVKQNFSRWYNKRNDRKGYLWSDRFKGVIVSKGEAQLVCSAYIDLNPVRANLVKRPEDYRWSSLGMQVRSPGRAKKLLSLISQSGDEFNNGAGDDNKKETSPGSPFDYNLLLNSKPADRLAWYREFVYRAGGVEREGKASISPEVMTDVIKCNGQLGIGESFRYRVKNISEGIAIGTHSFISLFQEKYKRKFIHPRSFLEGKVIFATRVLRK